jgi:hypothetical protein
VYYGTAKKDPTPATLSRTKSKKPTKTDLDLMQEKMDQIKAGTFVFELPETVGDVTTPATDNTVAKSRAVNYYNGIDDDDAYYGH